MGGGSYSTANASSNRLLKGWYDNSNAETFTSTTINQGMNPVDITLRESRDSDEHPNSLGIIIGLDVTGSMGSVPAMLVRDGLPNIVSKIIDNGEPDPQILFLGIGDHEYDQYPLQVGQFESSDEKLDHWLSTTYLESGGGGNLGESYLLAHYFAADYTAMDCFENRDRKGLLFTIGDEPPLLKVPGATLTKLMGNGQYGDYISAAEVIEAAQRTYEVYHIHLQSTGAGARFKNNPQWAELLGDHVLNAQSPDDVADIIIAKVKEHEGPINVQTMKKEEHPEAGTEEVL